MAVRTNILLKLSNFVDSVITFAKLQNIATNKILGRTTAGSGVIEELDIANYSNKLIPLTTTFADAENTASEINIITVTIPANSLAIGDMVVLESAYYRRQNSGGTINLTARIKLGATTDMSLQGSIPSDTTFMNIKTRLIYYVISISGDNATLTIQKPTSILTNLPSQGVFAVGGATAASGTMQTVSAKNTDVTIDKTISNNFLLTLQWATANANAYVRVETAQAYIIKKAV
jgi:hypothetical protein